MRQAYELTAQCTALSLLLKVGLAHPAVDLSLSLQSTSRNNNPARSSKQDDMSLNRIIGISVLNKAMHWPKQSTAKNKHDRLDTMFHFRTI